MLHDCFADEVAIDFPSVEPVIERMRDCFLGESHADPVIKAELLLSRQEAFEGLLVPVEVPIRGTCPRCGGRGETWTEPCDRCGGAGTLLARHVVRVRVPPRIVEGGAVRFRVISPDAPPVHVELTVRHRNWVIE